MAQFKDKQSQTWDVDLDAPLLDKIESLHKVDLTNLETDPLQPLRNSPRKLAAIVYLICESQIQAKQMTPETFAANLPTPPDAMLEAVAEAIVNFFPSGKHSHVREVLASFGEIASKGDEVLLAKMRQVLSDPNTTTRLTRKAEAEFERAMAELFPLNSEAGT